VRGLPARALAVSIVAGCVAVPARGGTTPRATTPAAAPARPVAGGGAFDRVARQAAAARQAGHLADAARLYEKALALKPRWVEGRWDLATVLYDLDRYAEARGHFAQVVAARPDDGVSLAMQSLCDVRLRNYDQALRGLQAAQALGVANPEVRTVAAFQAAVLLNRRGDHESAFEILRAFAADGKDTPDVIILFGLSILRWPVMPEDVPPDKQEMVRLAGRGGYHMARGRRTSVGRLALEELVSRYPTAPNVHYALGLYLAPEEPDQAIEEFRRELRADPKHWPSLLQVAGLETRKGNAKEAVPVAEQAVELAPALPGARLVLGRALLEAGDTTRAIEELEKGAALAPASRDLNFSLARAYQRAGRTEDAERARQEFLRLDQSLSPAGGATPPPEGEPQASPKSSREGGG